MRNQHTFKVTALLNDGSTKSFNKVMHYQRVSDAKSAVDYMLQFRCEQAKNNQSEYHDSWVNEQENYQDWRSYSIIHIKSQSRPVAINHI